jgi:K+-transporting ATPase KdpF subunit
MSTADWIHGRFLFSSWFHRVHRGDARTRLATGTRMSFSQIILFIIAVIMFGYLGFAMFKPEKF